MSFPAVGGVSSGWIPRRVAGRGAHPAVPTLRGLCAQQRGGTCPHGPPAPRGCRSYWKRGFSKRLWIVLRRVEALREESFETSRIRGERWGILRRPVKEKGEGCVVFTGA